MKTVLVLALVAAVAGCANTASTASLVAREICQDQGLRAGTVEFKACVEQVWTTDPKGQRPSRATEYLIEQISKEKG